MILSTICYIEKDGKYLMLHRTKKENDINKEKWLGIGGKFEEKESPEECIIREVKEETNLTLKSCQLRGILTFVSTICETEYIYLFTSDDFEGNLTKECKEGDLQWVEKEKIENLNLWEGDKIFLRKIRANAPFFTIKYEYDGDTLLHYEMKEYEYETIK